MAGSQPNMNESSEFHLSIAAMPRAKKPSAKLLSELLSGSCGLLHGKGVSSVCFARKPSKPAASVRKSTGLAGGKDVDESRHLKRVPPATDAQLAQSWSKACQAAAEAVVNRGREAHALKSMHDYLSMIADHKDKSDKEIAEIVQSIIMQLRRIKDWDRPQWFKKLPATLKDPMTGRMVCEHEMVQLRNHLTAEQMGRWDAWADAACKPFSLTAGTPREQLRALDDYIVRKVSVDSVKNWLRRRPSEPLINDMFAALATGRLYLNSMVQLRCLKDETGSVRAVEMRDGQLYFEGTDTHIPVQKDEKGFYVELPDDSDMIVFERRTICGARQIVPVAQPNGRDPNIQWFSGAAVKRGWQKEQRFFDGPQNMRTEELYGFFPDHFPMRLTNSMENRMPTEKVGGAIYGYAREHSGRQARQLIAEIGEVMPGLKRNNSQLINDARQLFGLQRISRVGDQPAAV